LDVWDGNDNEPIIRHGHTLTTSIRFQNALIAIRDNAFKTSPYPVVLSLETHCNLVQQDRMAQILQDILGEMLIDPKIEQVNFFFFSFLNNLFFFKKKEYKIRNNKN